jgi:peptidoglycan/LPS O-acetylase OafA/YrhL
MLMREWDRSGRIDLKQFYLRRFKRLAPALALVVVVTLGLTAWFGSYAGYIQANTTKTALGSVLLSANFFIAESTGGYFDAPAGSNPLLHTWSLAVEEQFYVIFPIILILGLALARRANRKAIVPSIVAGVGILSFTAMLLGDKENIFFGFYSPIPRAWEFVVGVLLAIWVHRFRDSRLDALSPRMTSLAGILGVALLLVSMFAIDGSTEFPSLWTLLPVLGTGLLIFSGLNSKGLLTRILSSRPFTKTGDWSYSIYLWHWPLIVIAGFIWQENAMATLLTAALAIPIAAAAYRWVEQPLRKIELKRVTLIVLAAACVAVPVQAANAVDMGVAAGWNQPAILEFREASAVTIGENLGCYQYRSTEEWTWAAGKCTFNGGSKGLPIYLLGDSNANHFGAGVIAAGLEMDRPVVMRTMQSCALSQIAIRFESDPDLRCKEFNTQLLAWLETQEPGTVLLGFGDDYLLHREFSFEDPFGERPAYDGDDFSVISEAMALTAKRINDMGHQVILVEPIPSFLKREGLKWWRTDLCSLHTVISSGVCGVPSLLKNEEVDEYQGTIWAAVRAAAKIAGAETIDVRAAICLPNTGCSTLKDKIWLYRDPTHLSVRGAEYLKDTFVQALTKN